MKQKFAAMHGAVAITASTGAFLYRAPVAFFSDPEHHCLSPLLPPSLSPTLFRGPGIAACNIGGITLHAFAGIGLGHESADELAKKIHKNKRALMRWERTEVLIIDEGQTPRFKLARLTPALSVHGRRRSV